LESFNLFLKDFNITKYKDIVFVSNSLKEKFLKYYNKNDKKMYSLNNIIDYERMIELSKEVKIKKNKLTLLNVGRHTEEEKNLTMMLNVIKKLLDESYDFELLLIGDGKDHEYYKELVKKLEVLYKVNSFGNIEKNIKQVFIFICICAILLL
jgi:glycosyltransferase involved in cell wall biosynthesis